MSYRVEYASSGIKRKQIRQRNGRALLLTAVCFLIFLLIVGGFWPKGAQALREILLPGDSAVTAAAWAELTHELHAGARWKTSAGKFLRMRDFVRVDVSACLMGAFLLLTLPLNWLLSALAAAAFHELCHGAAILLLGGRVWGVRIGAGGAVMETEPLSSGKELVCALAGPAGSLLLVLMFRVFPRVAVCALVQGAFNLLPVFPLDGGRALRCALTRICPKWANLIAIWAEWGTIGILGALALTFTFYWKLGMLPLTAVTLLAIKAFLRKRPCKLTRFGVQ